MVNNKTNNEKREISFPTLNKKAVREIYEIAGPLANKRKDKWIRLILNRVEKRGGYQGNKIPTTTKIIKLFEKHEYLTVEEICLKLSLLPSTVRKALRKLKRNGVVIQERRGKRIYWSLKSRLLSRTSPGKTAG